MSKRNRKFVQWRTQREWVKSEAQLWQKKEGIFWLNWTLKPAPFIPTGNSESSCCCFWTFKSTLRRKLKVGNTKAHKCAVKPTLTQQNKSSCLQFCSKHVDLGHGWFCRHDEIRHVHKQWFYLTKSTWKYYLRVEINKQYRTTKCKRYCTDVMLLEAVSRPRWNAHRNCSFDGKIKVWSISVRECCREQVGIV